MPLCFKRQSASSVLTPSVGSVFLFVDRDGLPSVKDSDGLATLLVSSVSGPAGGDLSGAFPSPSVVSTPALKTASGLVTVSGSIAPESGQVLTASDATTATWQDLPDSEPVGTASGDLVGEFPAPIVLRTAGLLNSETTVSTSSAAPPSAGQLLTASDDSTASWEDSPSATPGGPAGGNLSGSYPGPTVATSAALKSATTNVSALTSLAPTSGQMLIASSGAAASWLSPSTDLSNTWSSPTAVQARGLKTATTAVSVSSAAAPSAGQVLAATSPTAAAWASVDPYVRNEILEPPLSPNSADEEFTTDPFLGGSWIITNNIHAAQARLAGAVTPVTFPGSGSYRSELSSSTVFVQTPVGTDIYFMKQIPSPISGDQTWMAACAPIFGIASQANGPTLTFIIAADSGGQPDFNNKVEVGYNNNDSTGVTNDLFSGVTSAGVFTAGPSFNSNCMGVSGFAGFVIRKGASQLSGSGASSVSFGYFGPHGEMGATPFAVTSFSGNWAWAGFRVIHDSSFTDVWSQWCGITGFHFMRRKTSATAYLFG